MKIFIAAIILILFCIYIGLAFNQSTVSAKKNTECLETYEIAKDGVYTTIGDTNYVVDKN